MPCYPIDEGNGRVGFVCMANEPVKLWHNGQAYLFEWTGGCGWMPVNQDGTERLTPVPAAVWCKLSKLPRGD
jgi:hypothetical protein